MNNKEIAKEGNNNNNENEDNVNLEINNNLANEHLINDKNDKLNNKKNDKVNYEGLDGNSQGKIILHNYNKIGINDEINNLKKINNKLLSPKTINQRFNNILKPINILKTKNHKVPNSAFPTPNSKNNDISSNNKTNDFCKKTGKLTGITSPSSKIAEKKLFNDSNLTNIKKIRKEEKKNRNHSLVNILIHKDDNIKPIFHKKEEINEENYCGHFHDDFKANSKNYGTALALTGF
jgi:hypothetical protein